MKKSGIGSRCLLGLLVLVWASLAASTHWPLGLGNRCTAQAAGEEGTLKWKFQTSGAVDGSPAIGSDGTIYVGSGWEDFHLYAINRDGSLKWKFETGGWVYSSPAIGADGTIYVGSYDSHLYAINPDGSLIWKFKTGDEVVYSSPAIGSDGTVYVGSSDSYLYAINLGGTLIWKFKTEGSVISSPAIGSDGTIYVGSSDSYLYAINADGSLKWKFKTGGYVNSSSPAIDSDGTIYVGSSGDGYLYAINRDGILKWKFQTDENVGPPAIGSDGTIYVGWGVSGAYCCAINPDGSLKWKFQSGSGMGSPAIGYDGTIYTGGVSVKSVDVYFYAINPDGTVKWAFKYDGYPESSPVIGSDGTIYFGSSDGYLYAINSSSMGLANSPWPMFKHDVKHTGLAGIALGAGFSATTVRGTPPLTVQFTDRSGGEFNSWLWDFGDGSTSTKRNPSHVYTEVGDYTVSLTVAGPDGEDTATRKDYIRVGLEVKASFSATPTSGPVPLTVEFTDKSEGTIDSWYWDFGDGSTSTKQSPSHIYSKRGAYTVSLTVTGPAGRDEQVRMDYIVVGMTAAFSATPKSGAAPLSVQFTDWSTGAIDSRLWDFGDGSASTERSPSHAYTHAGAYTVSLTVTGPAGEDTEIKEECIVVGSEKMYVPDNFPTIQDAIDAAIDKVSTIIVRDGTYTGAGNVNLDFKGKEITVRSENGPEKCTIDGANSAIGFNFHSGEKEGSVISGFTIRNCANSSSNGGAISCRGSSPTVMNCVISGNSALRGAGIFVDNGSPVITHCTITDNRATQAGGGVHSTGSAARITGCTITGNSASMGAGVLIKDGSPVITGCTITGNHAEATGGGIHSTRSTARITGCSIAWNTAGTRGAGVLCEKAPSPIFTGCKIANNAAQKIGGGIYFRLGSSAAIINCLINGNTAISGGGISCKDSSPAITNSTIVGNSVRGITCYGKSNPAIANSILWGNQIREIVRNLSFGYRPRPKVTFSNISGGFAGEGNIGSDPMFVDPANGDYHLAVGSPSINTGNNDAPNVPQTDRDDHPRIVDGVVDMGAYEYQGN